MHDIAMEVLGASRASRVATLANTVAFQAVLLIPDMPEMLHLCITLRRAA